MIRMETAYTTLRRRVAAVMVLPPRAIARRSEEQCSIGLQPVFHSHHRAMLYFSPQIVYKSQGVQPGFRICFSAGFTARRAKIA
jgi:hypothetical protein